MKRSMLFLLLVFITVLALPGPSHAVQLQAGWYAWFGGVSLEGYEPGTGTPYSATWQPSSSLGQFGPVVVSEWEGYHSTRKITVPTTVSVAPGVLFEDAGSYSGGGRPYEFVYLSWETDYSAANMRLQLLRRRTGQADELMWQQAGSGHQVADGGNIWDPSGVLPGDELVFRVVALPEPSGVIMLAFGATTLVFGLMRRKR